MKKIVLLPLALALIASPALAHVKPGLWKETTRTRINDSDMGGSGGPFCILPSQADAAPVVGRDCTQKNVKWKGTAVVTGETVCRPPVSGTGRFGFKYKGDTHYDGLYAFSGKGPDGKALKMVVQYNADYAGPACGNAPVVK